MLAGACSEPFLWKVERKMSTKVYDGIRVDMKSLTPFLELVRADGLEAAAEYTARLMPMIKIEGVDNFVKGHYGEWGFSQIASRSGIFTWRMMRFEYLCDLYQEHSTNKKRSNPFDLQSGYTLIPYGKYFYGWPWGKFQCYRVELFKIPGVRDYAYWNNTDRDEEVTRREWKKRGDVWDKILDSRYFFDHKIIVHTLDFSPGEYATSATSVYLHEQLAKMGELPKPWWVIK